MRLIPEVSSLFSAKTASPLSLTSVAVLATVILSVTAPAHSADLLQVYRDAMANDAVYESARYAAEAGNEKLPQGRSGLLPTVGVGGSYSRQVIDSDISGQTLNRAANTNGYTFSLSQPLFRVVNWETYQQGKLQVLLSEAQFAQAKLDLMLRTSQAYFDVLAAQDVLTSVRAQKVAITEQLASAKRNFEVGTTTITDTHEAQARYDLVVAQEYSAVNDLEIKNTALQQIIGKPVGELATLVPNVELSPPQPMVIDQWVDTAVVSNFNVIGQELAREIASREIKKGRAGHYPTVDLIASRTHSNQDAATLTSAANITNTSNIGVQWNIPLFSGLAVNSRVRETISLEEKARADLENARRTAAQNARQAYLGVNNGLAQVKALEAAEVSSQSALESNRLGYEVGVRINIDVLNAQQQLYITRRDLSRARYDTIMNGLRLKAAAGVLEEADLENTNKQLR